MSYWNVLTVLKILDSPPERPSSYWDWLPPEIQDYILTLRDSQALIEKRESQASREMCDEILSYTVLKDLWSHGHLRLRPLRAKEESGYKCKHIKIYGERKHPCGEKSTFFLGLGYPQAFNYISDLRIRQICGVPPEVMILSRASFR